MLLQAYLVVAPQLAAFPGYHRPLAEALLRDKAGHWDGALRRLAAGALARLAPLDAAWYARKALPALLGKATNAILEASARPLQETPEHVCDLQNLLSQLRQCTLRCMVLTSCLHLAASG